MIFSSPDTIREALCLSVVRICRTTEARAEEFQTGEDDFTAGD
ncbi:hypothetical protein RHECNPAF_63002 [Rhizobium etli CNPAF512]|nr:hypothetical protein RHECNPAF_63002 [Rhizobium etli CNPAF512]